MNNEKKTSPTGFEIYCNNKFFWIYSAVRARDLIKHGKKLIDKTN